MGISVTAFASLDDFRNLALICEMIKNYDSLRRALNQKPTRDDHFTRVLISFFNGTFASNLSKFVSAMVENPRAYCYR